MKQRYKQTLNEVLVEWNKAVNSSDQNNELISAGQISAEIGVIPGCISYPWFKYNIEESGWMLKSVKLYNGKKAAEWFFKKFNIDNLLEIKNILDKAEEKKYCDSKIHEDSVWQKGYRMWKENYFTCLENYIKSIISEKERAETFLANSDDGAFTEKNIKKYKWYLSVYNEIFSNNQISEILEKYNDPESSERLLYISVDKVDRDEGNGLRLAIFLNSNIIKKEFDIWNNVIKDVSQQNGYHFQSEIKPRDPGWNDDMHDQGWSMYKTEWGESIFVIIIPPEKIKY